MKVLSPEGGRPIFLGLRLRWLSPINEAKWNVMRTCQAVEVRVLWSEKLDGGLFFFNLMVCPNMVGD